MKLRMTLLALSLAAPALSLAADRNDTLSYSWLQATYQWGTDEDIARWQVKGSYQINDRVFVQAEDGGFVDLRSVSLGYFAPISPRTHLYGQLGLADSNDGVNPIVELGGRYAANEELELRLAARYIPEAYGEAGTNTATRSSEEDELVFNIEAAYRATPRASIIAGVGIPTEADGTILELGGRFHF